MTIDMKIILKLGICKTWFYQESLGKMKISDQSKVISFNVMIVEW
jgi:hypothetical protein